ncbi:MAG: hypothetical protein ACK2TV_16210, partial [Anaerolineales bacterium]
MKAHPRFFFHFRTIILCLFVLNLIGCHFPQPTQLPLSESDQHKTEVAGILNPTQLSTLKSDENQPLNSTTPISIITTGEPPQATHEVQKGYIRYTTIQGDTRSALAARFGVAEHEIEAQSVLSSTGFLPIGISTQITDVLEDVLPYA